MSKKQNQQETLAFEIYKELKIKLTISVAINIVLALLAIVAFFI